ncbi:MAG TPA: M20/M25/M40 family metallo-hydrolase [Actinomycetota bacterium]|nr:M20/M25/M40 family metallo-hydrolase [Actinomycetota bacterium]
MSEVRHTIEERAEKYVGWLKEACSIPSLAEQPDGLVRMAAWLEERFDELGATTERLIHEGAPDALLAKIGTGERTVLIYDHYDVQPVDPIELWDSKPFDPDERDGYIYARGVADNKGDLIARLAALEVYKDVYGDLPIQVKVLVEGEEEAGSKSFETIVERHADRLAAEGCIWEGHQIDHAGRPDLVFGAKGLAYVELNVRGLNEDQHSSRAVVAPSPVWRLVEALATLSDPSGRVLIDGFYDDVVAPTERDIAELEALPFDEAAERERLGTDHFVGDVTGLEFKKRYFYEPTCNIAGLVAGFIIPGLSKTVLPKQAMAKVDMRLVPDQDPHDIVDKLRAHLDGRGFTDIEMTTFSMEHPVRSPSDSLIGRAAVDAAREIFGDDVVVAPMMIGTGPMYPIAHTLGIPTVSPAGIHRPDSNIHAPNEKARVDDFFKIIEYTVAYLKRFSELD